MKEASIHEWMEWKKEEEEEWDQFLLIQERFVQFRYLLLLLLEFLFLFVFPNLYIFLGTNSLQPYHFSIFVIYKKHINLFTNRINHF